MRTSRRAKTFERLRVAGTVIGFAALLIASWLLWPTDLGADALVTWFAPHRHAWYALPVVVGLFVGLGLVMVPVLLLITVTGLAFGPWLGPAYAMAGCLASASIGFAVGRKVGLRRVERYGGRHITRVAHAMARNGTLAVFLLRKIPLPFLLANVVAGAAHVKYRDFVVGTTLGMTAAVIALAGLGHQATLLFDDPSPRRVAVAVLALAIPLTLAWTINRTLRSRRVVA
jgi:phospholipase D1/2